MRIAFAECVFDPDTREVSRRGSALALSPKAFELLELLVRERPRALSKDKIHAALWPGVFVSDASLSNLVAELRAALGDDAHRPSIVKTHHRFGYAFVAEARAASPARPAGSPDRSVRLLWEAREIALERGENVLGRDSKAAAWIDDPSVSRHHALVRFGPEGATLEDLGSKNGTFLNGNPVSEPATLSDGDEIQIGRAAMTVRILEAGASTQTASGLKPPSGRRKP